MNLLASLHPALVAGAACLLTASAHLAAQSSSAPSPYDVPEAYRGKFDACRSPLLFDDGSKVEKAAGWSRRRAEILKRWTDAMGAWPPLIEHPKLETLSERKENDLTWRRVRLEIAPGQTGEGWLLRPEGAGPFPAVLVVYYEPETSVGASDKPQPFRDFGLQLAKRGFVTLSIGTPGGNAWKPETGAAVCQPLSFHAYVAASAWSALAALPGVDAKRIGITGHSYGGKWALFGGALWDKFAAVAVSDPGIVFDETRPNVNYWEPWYLGLDPAHPRPKAGIPSKENPAFGAYRTLREAGRDLTDIHALICPRPFFVSGGSEDPAERWTALNHAIAVNSLLGAERKIGMTNRPNHTPDESSNAALYAFFESALKERK